MTWSPERIARYAQHVLLPDVGGRGQDRLQAATVAVAIDGPASRLAALYLAAAGVGTVLFAGDDRAIDAAAARFPIGRAAIGGSLHAALAAALVASNPEVVVASASPGVAPGLVIAGDRETAPLAAVFARAGEAAARLVHAIATGAA
jgi:adenylyltransferase/sulfurtransferase